MNEYHRIYAHIDTDALYSNALNIKNAIPKDCLMMPIIKADGYGHGALKCAHSINDISDAFAVATIEEALELRGGGVNKPILILGTLSQKYFDDAVLNDISVNIYTLDGAKELSEVAKRHNKKVTVHIAVDTGMGRIGLSCSKEGLWLAKQICSFENLYVEGIFSHFATADESDNSIALRQRDKFDEFCSSLESEGIYIKLKHICNSAAVCSLGDKCYSMVRPGIILYGLYPSDEVSRDIDLKPVLSLKTHVSYIKEVPAGEGISYGHTYHTNAKRLIATIPVGYADGYPRALSNKGRVIIRGKYAPIVGRVCMDQFMVDITDIEGVKIEDSVTLIGTDGSCVITTDEIADMCGTINYEIVCGIGKRVPRVYK